MTPVEKTETIPYVTYKSETKTKDVTYTVNVPEYSMEPYEVTRYDRVAAQEVEEYTVTVPYCDTELVDVQVCKMVPKLVEETFDERKRGQVPITKWPDWCFAIACWDMIACRLMPVLQTICSTAFRRNAEFGPFAKPGTF